MSCLPKPLSDRLKKAIDSGEVDIEQLAKISSKDRKATLRQVLTKDVKGTSNLDEILTDFNKGFEEKMIVESTDVSSKIRYYEDVIKKQKAKIVAEPISEALGGDMVKVSSRRAKQIVAAKTNDSVVDAARETIAKNEGIPNKTFTEVINGETKNINKVRAREIAFGAKSSISANKADDILREFKRQDNVKEAEEIITASKSSVSLQDAERLVESAKAKSRIQRAQSTIEDLMGAKSNLVERQKQALLRYIDTQIKPKNKQGAKQLEEKVRNMRHLLESGDEQKLFLEDVVQTKFGFEVNDTTRRILATMAERSEQALDLARKVYDDNVPRLAAEYKLKLAKDSKELKDLRKSLDKAVDSGKYTKNEADKIYNNAIDYEAKRYGEDVIQGLRPLDDGIDFSKAQQKKLQMELVRHGLKTQELVEFLGYNKMMYEKVWPRMKEAFKIGTGRAAGREADQFRAFQLMSFALWDGVVNVLSIPKSLLASVDASVLLRQGKPVLYSNPKIYAKQLKDTFTMFVTKSKKEDEVFQKMFGKDFEDDFMKRATRGLKDEFAEKGQKEVQEMLTAFRKEMFGKKTLHKVGDSETDSLVAPKQTIVRAEIAMRPNALNGKYNIPSNSFGLNVLKEEAFPSSIPTRVPVLGKAFAYSESTFEAASLRWRGNLADSLIAKMEREGVDWTQKEMADSLGWGVSSLTGRGKALGLQMFEGNERMLSFLNVALFSPRFFGSRIEGFKSLLRWPFDPNPVNSLVAKQFAKNFIGDIATIYLIGALYKTATGETLFDTKFDSSTYGHLVLGDTAFDTTAGFGQYISILGRAYSASSWGGQQRWDPKLGAYMPLSWGENGTSVLVDFIANKQSPGGRVVTDVINGHGFGNSDIGTVDWIAGALLPLSIQISVEEYLKMGEGNKDLLHFSLILAGETFGVSSRDLDIRPMSKEWKKLIEADGAKVEGGSSDRGIVWRIVGSSPRYEQAVKKLNEEMFVEIKKLRSNRSFQEGTEEEQSKEINRVAEKLKRSTVDDFLE